MSDNSVIEAMRGMYEAADRAIDLLYAMSEDHARRRASSASVLRPALELARRFIADNPECLAAAGKNGMLGIIDEALAFPDKNCDRIGEASIAHEFVDATAAAEERDAIVSYSDMYEYIGKRVREFIGWCFDPHREE